MRLVREFLTLTALAAAIGALVTGCAANRQTVQAEADYPPIGQFVDVTGGRVHYVQQGAGPHVILIHGASGNLRDYTFDLMGQLTDRYTVTAFDRPGLGYTDRLQGLPTGPFATDGESPMQQQSMLREAAANLGITDPIVVGHSFGGIVAYAWAVADLDRDGPQNARAMVSFAGVAMPWPGDLGWYYAVNGSALGGAVVVPLISAFVPQSVVANAVDETFAPQTAPEGYADYIGATLVLRVDSFRANARQVNTLRPHVVALSRRYPELTLPIEIIHGTADTSVPPAIHSQEIIKIVPSARLTMLDGVGHMPHHIDRAAAIAAIDRAARRAGLR